MGLLVLLAPGARQARVQPVQESRAQLQPARKSCSQALPALGAAIRDVERELGGGGRVLVRYSGTEPKLRLLVEGPDGATAAAGLRRLEAAARADLEAV